MLPSRRCLLITIVVALLAPAGAAGADTRSDAPVVGIAGTAPGHGYWQAAADGGVFTFGDAEFHGSMGGSTPSSPVVGIARTPSGRGYWLVAGDGGVFSFGDAAFHGSMAGQHLNAPVVGMAPTPSGNGYWLVASDGGVFSFGDAPFHGSLADRQLNAPVAGIAATPSGDGYWVAAGDGGVFTFGDARFRGSMAGKHLNAPIVGLAAAPHGVGYWLVAGDGGVFSFGDAKFRGSMGDRTLNKPAVGMAVTPTGDGYWLTASDGGVFAFGDARYRDHADVPPPPALPAAAPAPAPQPPAVSGGEEAIRAAIVAIATRELGYRPARPGCAKYRGVCEAWCSDFTTWTWGQAGVPVAILPYSGDVWAWSSANTTASLAPIPGSSLPPRTPRPGDAVLFGYGYRSGGRALSHHVAIVSQVFPSGAIETINGNYSDSVAKVTFFPARAARESGSGYPVWAYASPVRDAAAGARARIARDESSSAFTGAALTEAIAAQKPKARHRRRRVPAYQHMPYRTRRVTIAAVDYLRSGRFVVRVRYSGSRTAAARTYRRFLSAHHDSGRYYRARFVRR